MHIKIHTRSFFFWRTISLRVFYSKVFVYAYFKNTNSNFYIRRFQIAVVLRARKKKFFFLCHTEKLGISMQFFALAHKRKTCNTSLGHINLCYINFFLPPRKKRQQEKYTSSSYISVFLWPGSIREFNPWPLTVCNDYYYNAHANDTHSHYNPILYVIHRISLFVYIIVIQFWYSVFYRVQAMVNNHACTFPRNDEGEGVRTWRRCLYWWTPVCDCYGFGFISQPDQFQRKTNLFRG